MALKEKHPLAGQTVKTKQGIGMGMAGGNLGGKDFVVEDWASNALGMSVWAANGNPAALEYAMRSAIHHLPHDENTLYGKIGLFGHIIHESEIEASD